MRTLFEEDEFPFFIPESGEIAIVGPVEESLAPGALPASISIEL
jgi:hypothetical protein